MEPSHGRITLSVYLQLIRHNANFRRLWFAQIISEIGDWMYTVAIYAQLLKMTGGSAKSIGLAFTMQVLPQMLVSTMAGVVNDRMSRRLVMIVSDVARAVIVALMLVAQNMEWLSLIFVLLFLETVFWATFEPGRSAVIPNIAEGEEMLAANTLSSITWSFNFAVGFSIGGLIAAAAGKQAVFVLNSLSFLLSAVLIARMKFREPHLDHAPAMRVKDLFDFSPVLEGIRYVYADKRLFATLLVKAGLGVMGANWVLIPILAERKFPLTLSWFSPESAGMLSMSVLMGSRGVGALIGPSVATFLAGQSVKRMRWGILMGFLMGGTGYWLLGSAQSIWMACVCLVWAHAGGSILWVFSTTLLQMFTEDRFRGRAFSAEFAFMTLSMSLSSNLCGAVLDAGRPLETVVMATGVAMLIPTLLWLSAQRLWRTPWKQPSPA